VAFLNDTNEPVMVNHFIFGNYSCDSFFGNYYVETSPYAESNTQFEILHCTDIFEPHCNITYVNSCDIVQSNIVFRDKLEVSIQCTNHTNIETKENSTSMHNIKRDPNMWTLVFDGLKSLEGASVGCILKDPIGKKVMITCMMEFQCTNNTIQYEALLQGLKKSIDLKAKKIKVFGDSGIVIR